MPGKRSPNCPAHDLDESIDKVSAIYRAEGRNSFSGSDAVLHMGYNGLNGASRRALGAVRAFGLLQGRGGQLKVSDDAVLIIADTDAEDQKERRQALLRALCHNRVFSDLYKVFTDHGTLSQLSGYLQKKFHFKPGAADHTAKVYQRSVALLLASDKNDAHFAAQISDQTDSLVVNTLSDYTEDIALTSLSPAGMQSNHNQLFLADPYIKVSGGDDQPKNGLISISEEGGASTEFGQDSFALENGAAFLRWPRGMSVDEFEDFTDWLILEHRKISRKVKGGDRSVVELRKHIDSG